MKIILNFSLFLMLGFKLMANPIAIPMVEISELYFDPIKGWQIELEYLSQQDMPIDSIWICSSKGKSKVKNFQIFNKQEFIVVSNDSLYSSVNIEPDGDSITVISFIKIGDSTEPFQDILAYGNYSNSKISKPKNGHSIARFGYGEFSKDKSPSIGFYNDTTGMCGTLKGVLFDRNNRLIPNRTFWLSYVFYTDQEGNYSTRLLSHNFVTNAIAYKVDKTYDYSKINPINITLEPDTVIDLNIYLQDSLFSGINELKLNKDFPIIIYPNPISRSDKLKFEIDLPVKTSNIRIELLSLEGKLLKSMKVTETSGEIEMQNYSGLCFLNIWLENELLSTNRIIVCND